MIKTGDVLADYHSVFEQVEELLLPAVQSITHGVSVYAHTGKYLLCMFSFPLH
jgi:hypothetical protein